MNAFLPLAARAAAVTAILLLGATTPALAGSPVPGPLLGAGAPALALFGAGYYLIRKRRAR